MSFVFDPTYGGVVGNVSLPPMVRGDTWLGFTVGPIVVDGLSPVTTLVGVKMTFRSAPDQPVAFELVTGTPGAGQGQLVITDATTWVAGANEQALPLAEGQWGFDIETTDSGGNVWTPIIGTLYVIPDFTHV